MTTMTASTASPGLPFSRPMTYDDLASMPDDGHRYELIDGVLIVSPAPVLVHQRTVGNLHLALCAACPDDLEVFLAPLDVVITDDTVLEPDLLVARISDLGPKNLPAVPVLAVEVLSPSTRRFDLLLKRSRLESAGCEHYWVVDPEEPSVLAWRLRGGSYVEAARASGDEPFRVTDPYEIELTPSALVRR
jgi:Uma2 family endonuclease